MSISLKSATKKNPQAEYNTATGEEGYVLDSTKRTERPYRFSLIMKKLTVFMTKIPVK